MILSDYDIRAAIADGRIIIDPPPTQAQFSPTALDVRVGDDFHRWKEALNAPGFEGGIDLDDPGFSLSNFLDFTEPVPLTGDVVLLKPNDFILVRTYEIIHLPFESQLAARIEGRSTTARLGVSAHVTAPTIHGGFHGKLVLEILNHGPFTVKLRPNVTCISQLIFEQVSGTPRGELLTQFIGQSTPLGTPRG